MLRVKSGRNLIAIREDAGWLLKDLMNNFKGIAKSIGIKKLEGRSSLFSYKSETSNRRVVVKRTRRGGIMSFLGDVYLFEKYRPFKEIEVADYAIRNGINTARILGIKIEEILPFTYRYTVVSEEIESAIDLFSFIKTGSITRKIIINLANTIERLWHLNIYHPDLNIKNILLKLTENEPVIYILDFDRAKILPELKQSHKIKNLARLNRSIEKLFSDKGVISRQDKLRFLKNLCAGSQIKTWAKKISSGLWLHKLFWRIW